MPLEYESVMMRYRKAKGRKTEWEDHLRQCYRYSLPERNTIDKWNPGQRKRQYLFDSTAVEALQDFADRLIHALVPKNTEWMELKSGTDIPQRNVHKVNEFLEDTTETLFSHIDSSNLHAQLNDTFLDLGISTGALICEEGDGIQSSLNFRSISLSELILENSSRGIVETVFRTITVPAKDLVTTWKGIKISSSLMDIIREKPTTEISLVEGVIFDELASGNKYTSIVIYESEASFLREVELDYNPYIVFRQNTIAGEVYGRGPIMRMLPDIKSLNRMRQDYLKNLSFQANGLYTAADDGVINPYTVRLSPGAIIPVGSNAVDNPSLRRLDTGVTLGNMEAAIEKARDDIRRALLSHPFGDIEDTPVRSATEMSIRNADNAARTLAASSRIQVELLERLISNSVNILKRAGKIANFKVNGKEVKIKFVNPASRQQDESKLASLGRFMEFMAVLPPEMVAQKIKIEDFPTEVADILGLPASLKRDEAEVEEVAMQQLAQAQQVGA